jgi:anaphase-promoting complex subunit 10
MRYEQDESYTPSKILIRSGTGYHDLQDVAVLDLDSPTGWQHLHLGEHGKDGLLRTHLIQLCIIANHQNGKDTHIRAIKLFTPRRYAQTLFMSRLIASDVFDQEPFPFTSLALTQQLGVR